MKKIKPEIILNFIYKKYKINEKLLKSKCRKPELVRPRIMAACLLKKYTNLSLTEIGDLLDRDHSTALYYNRQLKESYDVKRAFNKLNTEFVEKYISKKNLAFSVKLNKYVKLYNL